MLTAPALLPPTFRPAQATPLARALLQLLPSMGGNALIAHRVLRLLASAGEPLASHATALEGGLEAHVERTARPLAGCRVSRATRDGLQPTPGRFVSPFAVQIPGARRCVVPWWPCMPPPQMASRPWAPRAPWPWRKPRSGSPTRELAAQLLRAAC